VEPATAVAFAGLERLLTEKQIQPGEVVVVNATGHTLPAESHILGNQYVVNLSETDDAVVNGDLSAALDALDERVTTVLVVDDNNNDRRLMRKLLQRYKRYRMMEAKSGAEALDRVRDKKPDIIVTDLTMPEMDGFTLLETLKTNQNTAEIPVVVVSAKSRTQAEQDLLDRYAASVWLKGDFSRRELVEHIVAILGDQPIGKSGTGGLKTPPADANRQRVIIIDDNPDDVALLRKTLETDGHYTVIHANDGRDGLKAIHENQPDVIVMELNLPDLDGTTVLEKLASDRTINHIPVVVVTANNVTPNDMGRLPAHFEAVVQKASLDRGQFLNIIRNSLK
ncbi:MAG: response regulator, partial [Chloroflexota bacterium]